MSFTKELFDYIEKSSTSFHAIAKSMEMLESEGYERLCESEKWDLRTGGRYYVTRNNSSIIAFAVGEKGFAPFKIVASHSDSPTFKVKDNAELCVSEKYIKLNTEGYGGMIMSSWFDRPLSIAGRVVYEDGDKICEKLIDFEKDIAIIPSLAIHMNREINDGYKFNKQVDTLPLIGSQELCKGAFAELVAKEAGVAQEAILGSDLFLYNRMGGKIFGLKDEYISAPRLDDLACAFASLKAITTSTGKGIGEDSINICAIFDNEEVGSLTKQGADSSFLSDVLRRIALCLGASEEDFLRALADSFMISADNAHAVHPNHVAKSDENNKCFMNEGIVIKFNANQNYTTDAVSCAYFRKLCKEAGVPCQVYANRSDIAGGSTLGRLSSGHISIRMLDIGIAQLAMHSSYETMGAKDLDYMIKAFERFYSSSILKIN